MMANYNKDGDSELDLKKEIFKFVIRGKNSWTDKDILAVVKYFKILHKEVSDSGN